MDVVNETSLYMCALSLVTTITVLLIGLTQKVWRKRDGVIFLNIFLVDVVFSTSFISLCLQNTTTTTTATTTTSALPMSYLFVFSYLLSWCSQCIATISRYTTVSYPFFYKTILSRCRLHLLVAIVTFITLISMFSSSTLIGRNHVFLSCYHLENNNGTSCSESILCSDVVASFPDYLLCSLLAVHVSLIIIIYTIEGWLWKTAKRHRNHFQSLTSSIKSCTYQSSDSRESSVSFHPDEERRGSITQSIRKRVSLTYSKSPLNPHRTPVFYLSIHLLTVLLYGSLILTHLRPMSFYRRYGQLCQAAQVFIALRPIANAGHHLSKKSLRRFFKLIRKLAQGESRELFTEYYYEPDASAKISKRKKEIKLRRDSSYEQPRNV